MVSCVRQEDPQPFPRSSRRATARRSLPYAIACCVLGLAVVAVGTGTGTAARTTGTRARSAERTALHDSQRIAPFVRNTRNADAPSFLYSPLGSFTPDPQSAGWIAELQGGENYGLWVDSSLWTTPVYRASKGSPTATIRLPTFGTWITIPYKRSFRPDPSSDAQLAVIDEATGCEYEFEAFDPSTMTANSEATFNVLTGTGVHADDAGVTGSDISELGGLITPADIAGGSIDHALRYATPINAPTFVAPANRSDGGTSGGIPEGELMRLDPSLDLGQFDLTPFQRMVATALQRYGAYDADVSGSFKLYAENTIDGSRYASTPVGLPWSLASHLQFGTTTYAPGATTAQSNRLAGCAQQRKTSKAKPRRRRHPKLR
jgi:hypothetical protein